MAQRVAEHCHVPWDKTHHNPSSSTICLFDVPVLFQNPNFRQWFLFSLLVVLA
jgi:hypothetical protein